MSGIKFQRKIDGYVFLADNFEFLLPTQNVKMKLPFIIRCYHRKHFLKGFSSISSEKVYSVYLTDICDMSIHIFFRAPNDVLDYKIACSVLKKSFIQAIILNQNSETCKCFEQQVLSKSEAAGQVCVYVADFWPITTTWLAELKKTFNCRNGFQIYVYASATGQSCSTSYILSNFPQINWSLVRECVLHCAFDFSNPENLLLWNREALIQTLGVSPSYEYFPLALPNLGNFYFTSNLEDQQNPIKMIKFYSEFAKYFHKSSDPPFKTSTLGNFIVQTLSSGPVSENLNTRKQKLACRKYLNQCKLIKDFIQKEKKGLYARCEILVASIKPENNLLQNMVDVAERFLEEFNIKNCSCLSSISSATANKHLFSFMFPACSVLQNYLEQMNDFLSNQSTAIFHFTFGKQIS